MGWGGWSTDRRLRPVARCGSFSRVYGCGMVIGADSTLLHCSTRILANAIVRLKIAFHYLATLPCYRNNTVEKVSQDNGLQRRISKRRVTKLKNPADGRNLNL